MKQNKLLAVLFSMQGMPHTQGILSAIRGSGVQGSSVQGMPRIPDILSGIRGSGVQGNVLSGIQNKILAVSYTGLPFYGVLLDLFHFLNYSSQGIIFMNKRSQVRF